MWGVIAVGVIVVGTLVALLIVNIAEKRKKLTVQDDPLYQEMVQFVSNVHHWNAGNPEWAIENLVPKALEDQAQKLLKKDRARIES